MNENSSENPILNINLAHSLSPSSLFSMYSINFILFHKGLTLSGGDSEEARNKIRNGLLEQYPGLSQEYDVYCDTVGAIATACENGKSILMKVRNPVSGYHSFSPV